MGAVRHHARDVLEIVSELLTSVALRCGADNRHWTLTQSRKGPNSFWLTDGQRQFHFRYDHNYSGAIFVKDRYHNGKVIRTITSRLMAERFIAKITAPATVTVPVP